MSRITELFADRKLFIPFITAGDPDLAYTEKLVPAMAEAGADMIELGIPFSDPVAEGDVIQRASERALLAGTTLDHIFDMVKRIRKLTQIPVIFMTYTNLVFHYGIGRFCERCEECGVDGLILPDLPLEERGEFLKVCEEHRVDLIPLAAPTSKNRIKAIAEEMKGFVYLVSSLGVTGVRNEVAANLPEMVNCVKKANQFAPCAVGFGIATPSQAAEVSKLADGVIVGSAIVKLVEEYGRQSLNPVTEYIREMKGALCS